MRHRLGFDYAAGGHVNSPFSFVISFGFPRMSEQNGQWVVEVMR